MRVILLSYICDGTDVGESLVAFKWAKALAEQVDLTVLAFERPGRKPLSQQLPEATVITWPEPSTFRAAERFNAMLKPAYPVLFRNVRRWLREQQNLGVVFDLAHQIMPLAARYPSPFHGQGIPYIIGPLGGTLETPKGFTKEIQTSRWYTRLRYLDKWRFRYDPWLRKSYSDADLILGVASYMEDALTGIPIKKFKTVLELGVDDIPRTETRNGKSEFNLLHVGRGVRTKGLRDAIRALPLLSDLPNIVLTSAGRGEEIEICRQEAVRLGVADRVRFLGHLPKSEIEKLYQNSDIFVFPSFREPTGGVIYEAMRWGLPIITVDYGGPASIVKDNMGIKLPVTTPEELVTGIANSIRDLHSDSNLRLSMGNNARENLLAYGLWTKKAELMKMIYEDISRVRIHNQ
ncbi:MULTISPECIES: glycosyltransferase family 4 protein [unclassified Ruegeria]|uniref:glycosyltransferase family 4 protein n=1 Tax=unclassified Ruegeria TaxID=2625375 RepID=UPI001AE14A4C|nr:MULTISPECIES: glycosyltransferase family 4 protein [unclassified Ruegeria]